ncbi:MAG: hypothetical protein ACK4SY_03065 [Pyrobaculum sp.]
MEVEVLEARYQRAVFRGSTEVLQRDFMLRYGGRWGELWGASEGATEDAVSEADRRAEGLAALVESRIDDMATAALYAAYGRSLSLEKELAVGMRLLERPGALEKLLRWGLAMHFADEVVAAPPYLAKLLLKLMEKTPGVALDVWGELSPRDGPTLAHLEGLLTGEFDPGLHQAIYGHVPNGVEIGRVAAYLPEVGLVVNPQLSPEELLAALLELKRRRADAMAKSLSLHGEYEFSQEYRCGLHYLSIDGSLDKSGVVVLCPWMSYSRRLWKKIHNLVLVVEGQRPTHVAQGRFAAIYIRGGEAEVVRPPYPSKLLEYIVDILYSVGFLVWED